jgi:CBS domain-containing protein
MPFIIKHLIPEAQNLITVTESDSAQRALSLMIEHDFSQLPVIDSSQQLRGMVTSDSILRAVSYFEVIPKELKVSHAMVVKASAHRDEDDLSDLLRELHNTSAIPIVDGSRKVIAIVTNHDTAEYFRHRAADLMLAENIELTLRDLILSASGSDTETDNEAMAQLIQAAMPSDKEHRKKFKSALNHYVNQSEIGNHIPDQTLLDSVFDQHLKQSAPQKAFKKLTLSELIRIVQNLWSTYQSNFNDMPWNVVGPLLNDVRETRNAIAHFNEVRG